MAEREAGIRVTMKSAGFMSGLREMSDSVKRAGSSMGNALSGPIKKGMNSAGESIKGLANGAKEHMKTVATLGGAFAIGEFVRDAVKGQVVYRNIAHELQKVNTEIKSWKDVHAMIEPIAEKVGQSGDDMAAAFQEVFSKTGDLKFSQDVLESIGTAATASGKNVADYGTLAQMAFRKFGASADDIKNNMGMLDSMLGTGGVEVEGLSAKFGMMSTEAVSAGLTGTEGMISLLGAMKSVNEEVGEKAPGAFKAMFQTFKHGSAALAALQKSSGVKFEANGDAFGKLEQLLKTKKGRMAAELTFKGDARSLFDALAKPFDAAVSKAKGAGKKNEDAVKDGIAAFRQSIGVMDKGANTWEALQAKAAERMKNDPSIIWQQALEKMADVFGEPKMMDSLVKLAQLLPVVATGFEKAIAFITNHPLMAAGGFVGAKVGLAFGEGMLLEAGKKLGLAAIPLLQTGAVTAGVGMGTAAKGAMVAAAALIGWEIGKAIADAYLDSINKDDKQAGESDISAFNAVGSKDVEAQKAALEKLRADLSTSKDNQTGADEWLGKSMDFVAKGVGGIDEGEGLYDRRAKSIAAMEETEKQLMESIKRNEDAHRKSATANTSASQSVVELGRAAAEAAKLLSGKPGGGGPPAPLPVTPGHGG